MDYETEYDICSVRSHVDNGNWYQEDGIGWSTCMYCGIDFANKPEINVVEKLDKKDKRKKTERKAPQDFQQLYDKNKNK